MHSPFSLLTHFTSIFNYSLTFCIILHAFLLKRLNECVCMCVCVNLYRRFSPRSQSSPLFRCCFFASFLSRISVWCVRVHAQTHRVLLFCIHHRMACCCWWFFLLRLCIMSGDITHILTQTQPFTYFINKLEYLPFCHFSFNCLLSLFHHFSSFSVIVSLSSSLPFGFLYDVLYFIINMPDWSVAFVHSNQSSSSL